MELSKIFNDKSQLKIQELSTSINMSLVWTSKQVASNCLTKLYIDELSGMKLSTYLVYDIIK